MRFRKLSLEAHPDKAGDSPEVLKRFQEISEGNIHNIQMKLHHAV
jgi:curved DNA-binding protein CbpA